VLGRAKGEGEKRLGGGDTNIPSLFFLSAKRRKEKKNKGEGGGKVVTCFEASPRKLSTGKKGGEGGVEKEKGI